MCYLCRSLYRSCGVTHIIKIKNQYLGFLFKTFFDSHIESNFSYVASCSSFSFSCISHSSKETCAFADWYIDINCIIWLVLTILHSSLDHAWTRRSMFVCLVMGCFDAKVFEVCPDSNTSFRTCYSYFFRHWQYDICSSFEIYSFFLRTDDIFFCIDSSANIYCCTIWSSLFRCLILIITVEFMPLLLYFMSSKISECLHTSAYICTDIRTFCINNIHDLSLYSNR